MLHWQTKYCFDMLPNNSTSASMVPSLLAARHEYFPYWRFSTVRTRSVVSVNSSAVAKWEMLQLSSTTSHYFRLSSLSTNFDHSSSSPVNKTVNKSDRHFKNCLFSPLSSNTRYRSIISINYLRFFSNFFRSYWHIFLLYAKRII